MRDFWDQIILSNPLRKYLFVVIAILVGLIFKRFLSKYIAGLLYRVASTVGSGIDKDAFVKLLLRPLETFLLVFITVVSLEKLHFPNEFQFEIYEVTSKSIIQAIAKIILICVFIWLLMRTIDFIGLLLKQRIHATGDMKDHQLVVFFRDFLKAILLIIGILMVLGLGFGFEVSKLWTSLGIAGAALALSAKESIENLIASFIIFFDKPFTAGDVLKVQNITGTVEKIGLRSTRIRTDQKTYVTVPNKQMVDSIVDNQTLRTQRKAEIRLQIGLSASPDVLQQFIQEIEKILNKEVIEDSSVFLNDIAVNAFFINVDFFTAPIAQTEFNQLKQDVNLEILKLMNQYGLQLAGATMDVNIINSAKS